MPRALTLISRNANASLEVHNVQIILHWRFFVFISVREREQKHNIKHKEQVPGIKCGFRSSHDELKHFFFLIQNYFTFIRQVACFASFVIYSTFPFAYPVLRKFKSLKRIVIIKTLLTCTRHAIKAQASVLQEQP